MLVFRKPWLSCDVENSPFHFPNDASLFFPSLEEGKGRRETLGTSLTRHLSFFRNLTFHWFLSLVCYTRKEKSWVMLPANWEMAWTKSMTPELRYIFSDIGLVSSNVNRKLTQQDGRMTKKCRVRLGMHSLASQFIVILPLESSSRPFA